MKKTTGQQGFPMLAILILTDFSPIVNKSDYFSKQAVMKPQSRNNTHNTMFVGSSGLTLYCDLFPSKDTSHKANVG
jgi:hypothetical protein